MGSQKCKGGYYGNNNNSNNRCNNCNNNNRWQWKRRIGYKQIDYRMN